MRPAVETKGSTQHEGASSDAFARAAETLARQRPTPAHLQGMNADISAGRVNVAERDLSMHLARNPEDADALYLMARAQLRLGQRHRSSEVLRRCLDLAPDFAAARFNHADLLQQSRDYTAALDHLDRLLAGDPRNPLYRQLRANILQSLGDNDESLAISEELAGENPDRADSWISYGHALRAVGQAAQSEAAYRKAIQLRSSSGKAYWALANMKTVRFSEADIQAMEWELKQPNGAPEDRIQLQYALGKAYEDEGAYARSFDHYAKGNAAMRLRIPYNPNTVSRLVADTKRLFTPAFLEDCAPADCSAPGPIFVVCPPRSGSTLIEQILSSHPAIEATGELSYITAIARRLEEVEAPRMGTTYPEILKRMEPAALRGLGEEYLQRAWRHRRTARPFFVDKKPSNFLHLGLILLILPNAKIIDARRHPIACCFSMFKQYFKKPRPRQAELGRFYRDYVELMAHFDRIAPDRVHRVIYEEMVTEPEEQTRKLLDYLGLPFEESCLRFYETKRSVLTPSSEQVRRPISREGLDQWRNYEQWLGTLKESLGTVLKAYPAVPEELR